MLGIILGIILIFIGIILVPFGFSELREELHMVKETSRGKRIFVYLVTFIGFLSLDNFLGWLLTLGFIFIFAGAAFILLTIF